MKTSHCEKICYLFIFCIAYAKFKLAFSRVVTHLSPAPPFQAKTKLNKFSFNFLSSYFCLRWWFCWISFLNRPFKTHFTKKISKDKYKVSTKIKVGCKIKIRDDKGLNVTIKYFFTDWLIDYSRPTPTVVLKQSKSTSYFNHFCKHIRHKISVSKRFFKWQKNSEKKKIKFNRENVSNFLTQNTPKKMSLNQQ